MRYIWLGNRLEKRWMLPMVPNPANPNGQDQFVDPVQGPAAQNQAQGPAVQGPAAQAQGPAV